MYIVFVLLHSRVNNAGFWFAACQDVDGDWVISDEGWTAKKTRTNVNCWCCNNQTNFFTYFNIIFVTFFYPCHKVILQLLYLTLIRLCIFIVTSKYNLLRFISLIFLKHEWYSHVHKPGFWFAGIQFVDVDGIIPDDGWTAKKSEKDDWSRNVIFSAFRTECWRCKLTLTYQLQLVDFGKQYFTFLRQRNRLWCWKNVYQTK